MTREEFEKKLFEFSNAAAASWRIDTTKQYKESRESILAEFDRLTAELAEAQENAQLILAENYIDPLDLAKQQMEDEG